MTDSRVIVNADDLGLDSETNGLIWEAFALGCVSSATLMANMLAFEEACAGIAERGLHGAVGWHFNLTYGERLTDGLGRHPRVCRDGQFDVNLPPWRLRLEAASRTRVGAERRARG